MRPRRRFGVCAARFGVGFVLAPALTMCSSLHEGAPIHTSTVPAPSPSEPAGARSAEVTGVPLATSTIGPEDYLGWATYAVPQLRVAFDYPAYFDLAPYAALGCQPMVTATEEGIHITIGLRMWMSTSHLGTSTNSLAEHVEREIGRLEESGEVSSDINWGYVGGARSATVEYHFGGTSRYGVFTYFMDDGTLFTVSFSAGETCGGLAYNEGHDALDEFDAFWRLPDSFRFTD